MELEMTPLGRLQIGARVTVLAVAAVVIVSVGAEAAGGNFLSGVVAQPTGWPTASDLDRATDGLADSYLYAQGVLNTDAVVAWSFPRQNVARVRVYLRHYMPPGYVLTNTYLRVWDGGSLVWSTQLPYTTTPIDMQVQPGVTGDKIEVLVKKGLDRQYLEVYEIEGYATLDSTPPAVPTGLSAVPGDGQVLLSWSAVSDPDLAKYRIYRDGVLLIEVTGTTYADTGLTNGQMYIYQVSAVDTSGNESAKSAAVTATPTGAPVTPVLQLVSRSQTTVDIAWEPIGNADGFRVYRNGFLIAQLPSESRTFHDSGLTPETEYTYKLVAYNNVGESQATLAVTTLPPPPPPPDPPSTPVGLGVIDMSKTTASLGWSASSGLVRGYRVYRNGVLVAETRDTVFTDRNLLSQTRYYYQVVAFNEGGESPPAAVAVTTLAASFSETVRAGLESSLEQAGDYVVSAAGSVAPWIVVIAALVTAVKLGSWFLGLWR